MTDVSGIPMEHGLALAGVLFALSLLGLLVRRNQSNAHADLAGDRTIGALEWVVSK